MNAILLGKAFQAGSLPAPPDVSGSNSGDLLVGQLGPAVPLSSTRVLQRMAVEFSMT
jgi:hypothetical protein